MAIALGVPRILSSGPQDCWPVQAVTLHTLSWSFHLICDAYTTHQQQFIDWSPSVMWDGNSLSLTVAGKKNKSFYWREVEAHRPENQVQRATAPDLLWETTTAGTNWWSSILGQEWVSPTCPFWFTWGWVRLGLQERGHPDLAMGITLACSSWNRCPERQQPGMHVPERRSPKENEGAVARQCRTDWTAKTQPPCVLPSSPAVTARPTFTD